MPRTTLPKAPPIPAVHPDRDALLRAIRAAPDDDAPRLVYADWQDEHGQPEHAELIRAQCELGRLKGWKGVAGRRGALRDREGELLRSHALRVPGIARTDWERGFPVYSPTIECPRHPAGRPDPAAAVPFDKILGVQVRFDRINDTALDDRAIAFAAKQPWVGRMVSVEFLDFPIGPGSLSPLAGCKALGDVNEIDFWRGTLDADEFARLVLAKAIAGPLEVSLTNDCRVTGPAGRPDPEAFADAVRRIAHAPRADNLTTLYLDTPEFGDAAARAVLDSPRAFRRLTDFAVSPKRLSKKVRDALRDRLGDRLRFFPW